MTKQNVDRDRVKRVIWQEKVWLIQENKNNEWGMNFSISE
jgi:hypothetical protein